MSIVVKSFFQRWFGASPSIPIPDQETTETLAQRGSAEAQFSLGLKYASGEGAALDYHLAEGWYLKAAGQNHALAHLNLGVMYSRGHGHPADAMKSMAWIQKAAELGDASAQFRMGELKYRAVRIGVSPANGRARIDAYTWYRLAADQGFQDAATACDTVNLNMTRLEVVEATRRVADFNAKRAQHASSGK